MRKCLIATAALLAVSAPADAKDNSFYAGIEAGVLFPRKPSLGDINVDFTTTNATIPPGGQLPGGGPPGPADFTSPDPFSFDTNTGVDADFIAGYDFGMFRLEGELGYKHAKIHPSVSASFLNALNAGLNRPSAAPDPGAPGLPALTAADFNLDGKVHAWSAMLNALADFGGNGDFGAYIGGGVGYADVHAFSHSQGKFAWQAIAGVYYPISDKIDIGLKGRYFSAGSFDASDMFAGNTDRFLFGPLGGQVPVDQTTNAVLSPSSTAHFRSISLLASLVYSFGAAQPPAPPAPPPPQPPSPPTLAPSPAPTQTCADGSIILATDFCPVPPPPPSPPAQRGERGI